MKSSLSGLELIVGPDKQETTIELVPGFGFTSVTMNIYRPGNDTPLVSVALNSRDVTSLMDALKFVWTQT
jgi:hypothetical protein